MKPFRLWKSWTALFEEEGPQEPRYDPIHLAAVLVAFQVAVGLLFWLLWGAMVYEGGFGAGEGKLGNAACLVLLGLFIEALRRADRRHARASK